MSKQLLFYTSAPPVSAQRHKGWGVEPRDDYAFAAETNSVPLMAIEFMKVAGEYSIVFAGDKDRIMPAAILGLQNDSNLYVGDDGKWSADYIPAFVRRYPFVFSSGDDGKTFTLCIDEDYDGLKKKVTAKSKAKLLFDEDGERTDYLNGVLDFLKEYQTEYNRTQLLCEKLIDMDLLEPMQAQIKLNSGEQLSLTGFQAVSREKLNALDPEKLADLVKSGALELIYIHLYSMKNFTEMMERLSKTLNKDKKDKKEITKKGSKKDLEEAEPAGNA